MLLLLFETSDGRYALDTSLVVEIIPLIRIRKIPKSPEYMAGIINYRGKAIPVVDLCALTGAGSCEQRLSTRIIIVNYAFEGGMNKVLGLVAERVTETIKRDGSAIIASGILVEEDAKKEEESEKEEMIQWFDLAGTVPEHLIKDFFKG